MGIWFIVRHGETEWNARGRIQGHTNIGLSATGTHQSRLIAKRLAKIPIDAAYSSDLLRSVDTAREILRERTAPLQTTSQLREYHKGVFEGLTNDEARLRYPDLHAASLVKDLDFAPSGGESTRQTSIRIASFVARLRQRHIDDNLLIVGHGGSLRAAFVALMDLPLEANWRFFLTNCSLSVVHIYPDNAVLRLYNDTSHLDVLGPPSITSPC